MALADIFRDATAVIDALGWDPRLNPPRETFKVPLTTAHVEQLHKGRTDLLNHNLDLLGEIGTDQEVNAIIASEIHARTDGSLNWEFDLVGVLDAEDPAVRGNTDVVLINVAHFDEARQFGKGKTGWYVVRVVDSEQAKAVSSAIDTLFMNSPDETKTAPEKEFAIGFAKQIGDVGALVTRILIASVLGRQQLAPGRPHRGRADGRHRAAAGGARGPAAHRRRAGGAVTRWRG